MANTVTITKLIDGPTKVVALVAVASDGSSGDLSDTVVLDVSAMNAFLGTAAAPTRLRIWHVSGHCVGCTARLEFDATTDDLIMMLPDFYFELDLKKDKAGGGLKDPQSSGTTGDVVLTTVGMSTAGDGLTLYIEAEKIG